MKPLSRALFLAFAVAAVQARAQDNGGTVVVVTDVVAVCSIANGPSGPSPLVAKLSAGTWNVSCAVAVAGVNVRRNASVDVLAGQARKVTIALKGGG